MQNIGYIDLYDISLVFEDYNNIQIEDDNLQIDLLAIDQENGSLVIPIVASNNLINGSIVNKEREVPDYIQMDEKNKKAKLIRVPKFSEIPYPTIMEPNLVIEYYSR